MARQPNASYESGGQRISVGLREFCIGSVLLSSEMALSDNDRHNVCGAYSEVLLSGIFDGIAIPNGYRKAYRLSATASTDDGGTLEVGINGKALMQSYTWSKTFYRKPMMSQKFYSWDEFPKENVDGYSDPGLNLYVRLNAPSRNGYVSGILLHGYLEKIV